METFFMNSKNSKTNESYKFKYDLIDKLDLKNPNKNMVLANLSIYYTWKNVKSTYNNNKFKISVPTWKETFDLPDGSYNISEIQDYIEYIIKKHELNKEKDNNQLKKNKKKLKDPNVIVKELESELDDKEENIKTLKDNNKDLKNIIKIKDIEIEKLEKIKINYDKEIKESEEELEKTYKNINEKKVEYNKLKILNDELNEEIEELKKEL